MFELTPRIGPRPETTDCAPHEQVSQNPDASTYQKLKERAFDFPFVERRRSIISVPGAEAHLPGSGQQRALTANTQLMILAHHFLPRVPSS